MQEIFVTFMAWFNYGWILDGRDGTKDISQRNYLYKKRHQNPNRSGEKAWPSYLGNASLVKNGFFLH
jgi:hypothetical protein